MQTEFPPLPALKWLWILRKLLKKYSIHFVFSLLLPCKIDFLRVAKVVDFISPHMLGCLEIGTTHCRVSNDAKVKCYCNCFSEDDENFVDLLGHH